MEATPYHGIHVCASRRTEQVFLCAHFVCLSHSPPRQKRSYSPPPVPPIPPHYMRTPPPLGPPGGGGQGPRTAQAGASAGGPRADRDPEAPRQGNNSSSLSERLLRTVLMRVFYVLMAGHCASKRDERNESETERPARGDSKPQNYFIVSEPLTVGLCAANLFERQSCALFCGLFWQ